MPEQIDPEVRRKRIAGLVKLGALVVVGFVVAPVIFLAVKGLVGLVIAGAVGFVAIQLAPVLADKVANWRVKLMIAEAEANPIETMTNIRANTAEAISKEARNVQEFEGSLADYHDQVADLSRKYPDEAERYKVIEQKMTRGLEKKKRDLKTARAELVTYEAAIDKAKTLWDIARATDSMTEKAGEAREKVFEDIKNRVAFGAVNHRINTAVAAFSAMDTDADEAEGLRLLSGDQAMPITRSVKATVAKGA